MSYTELFQTIRDHADEEGQALLAGLEKGLRKYEVEYAADALDFCLNSEAVIDEMRLVDAPGLVDELEASLKRNFTPKENQKNAYETDLRNWFVYMRTFLEMERLDGAREIMTFFNKIFNREGKKICGAQRSRCPQANDGTCMHKFSAGEYVCPECDTPRSLCKRRIQPNGRCGRTGMSRGHGGQALKGALSHTFIDGRESMKRGSMFADKLEKRPDLREMYIQAMSDPDYLSLLPEIALLAARRGELLGQLDDLDPQEIEAQVTTHVNRIRDAIEEETPLKAFHHAQEIIILLTRGKDNRQRWHEMNAIAGQMAKLADTERKRLVEAKKAVPIASMLRLQQETIKSVRYAIITGAEVVYNDIMVAQRKGILDKLNPDHIKRTMLRHMADQLNPVDADPDIVEGEVE